MNTSKTTLQTFKMGDHVVTTVHRIECDGTESADVLAVNEEMHIELEETAQARTPAVRENVYGWQAKTARSGTHTRQQARSPGWLVRLLGV